MRKPESSGPIFLPAFLCLFLFARIAAAAASPQRNDAAYQARLTEEVRHQLVLLPFLSVFDNLQYQVNGTAVTLSGQVTQPTVKIDAVNAVKHVEGVTSVNDQIEVLPLSPMDDQIRHAEYRSIYGFPALQEYAWGAVPPVHIIVKNGHVTLEGTVLSDSDKTLFQARANEVPNVFSVTNNLQVRPGH
jgi:hyperosmotically inducible protein